VYFGFGFLQLGMFFGKMGNGWELDSEMSCDFGSQDHGSLHGKSRDFPIEKSMDHCGSLCQWPFQDPKLEVPTIYKAYVRPM
jgi:hypothetical protein